MKKKLLLTLALVAVLVFTLAICISAETPAQYMEFKVLLQGDTDYTTVYVSAYKESNGNVDMYTVKVPMGYDFYSDIDFTNTIEKTSIVKIDMSEMMAYGFNNNNVKQFIVASDNSPYANVTEIKLPNYPGNFNYVSNNLCKNWTSLTTIDFGSAYQTGDNCFEGCTALTELVIPESITRLNNNGFKNCTGLTKLEILGSATFGSAMFQGCTSLTDVTLVQVKDIGGGMFNGCSNLSEITIPETVTSIGSTAFMGTKLVSLHIPAKVKTIGVQVLEDVTTFTTLTFAENSELEKIEHRAFQRTSLSGALVIPDSVTTINYSAFADTDITSVALPSGLTTLTSSIFSNCKSLESVELPENLEKIENNAFRYCSALTTLDVPNTVTNLGEYVFDGCTAVTLDIDFSSFTTIGKEAFKGYTGQIGVLDISNATSIGGSTFYGCTGITEVILSNQLTKLEANTFNGCTSLTSIHIPASVKSIGSNCFDSCTSLATVTFEMNGAQLEKVEAHSFQKTAIKEIIFPNSLLRIGQSTFSGCSKLESVNLGASFIDFNANNASQPPFANGSTLKYVYLSDTFNGVRDKVFTWNDNNANEYNKFYLDLTFFYTGTKAQAEAILQAAQGVNTYISTMTLISADDYAKAVADGTLATGVSGTPARYLVYDYSQCKAFYNDNHVVNEEKLEHGENRYFDEANIVAECTRCSVKEIKQTLAPLFKSLGYSYSSNAVLQGFAVNKTVIEKYKTYYNTEIEFGVVAALSEKVIDGQVLNATNKASVDFTQREYDIFEMKISNISEENKEKSFFLCAYVTIGGETYYLNKGTSSTDATDFAITYNSVSGDTDNKEITK